MSDNREVTTRRLELQPHRFLGGGRGGGGAVPKLETVPASWTSVGSDTGSSTGVVAQLLTTNRDKLKNTPNIEPPLLQHSRVGSRGVSYFGNTKTCEQKVLESPKP